MKRIIAFTLASVLLTLGLAGVAQANPARTANASPPVSARVEGAELSALTSKLAKLHLKRGGRLSARQLKALGLKPDPSWLAARFKELAKSTRARAADAGSTYWFTTPYAGQVWVDVYYTPQTVPVTNVFGTQIGFATVYTVYSNYVICSSTATQAEAASPDGTNCIDTNVYTYFFNTQASPGGPYYYETPNGDQADADGFPFDGWGPLSG